MRLKQVYKYSTAGKFVTVEDLIHCLNKLPSYLKIKMQYSSGVGEVIIQASDSESVVRIKPYDVHNNYKEYKA